MLGFYNRTAGQAGLSLQKGQVGSARFLGWEEAEEPSRGQELPHLLSFDALDARVPL